VGARLTLGAGILPNHRGTMMGWIGDSQSIKPGNRMPTYDRLSADELEAIAIWLEQQR
jgi:cytochrome c oxidase subunit 2